MSTMQKTKGKNYETKVATMLHTVLMEKSEGYRKLVELTDNKNILPKRDFSSGVFNISNGDIELGIAKKFFPFSIECKHHKDLNLNIDSIFKDKIKKIFNIWNTQVVPQSENNDLKPLLVFRANRTDDYVIYSIDSVKIKLDSLKKYIKIDGKILCLFSDFLNVYISENSL